MFLVERKKFFTSIMGRTYDGGKKLTKAEKKEKEEKEIKLKKQKLEKMGHLPKTVKQEKERQEPAKTDVNIPGDEDMPMLIGDDDDISNKEGTEKEVTFKKHPCRNATMTMMLVTRKEQKRHSPPKNHHCGNHPANNFRLQNLFAFDFKIHNH